MVFLEFNIITVGEMFSQFLSPLEMHWGQSLSSQPNILLLLFVFVDVMILPKGKDSQASRLEL